MPARVNTEMPADSLRAFAAMAWEKDLMREDHPARLGISAVRNLARYAPAGKRVRLSIEWETEADAMRSPVPAAFAYQSEDVGEAFTEWCSANSIEARNDQEYRWLRQAFTAGMNVVARYPELLDDPADAPYPVDPREYGEDEPEWPRGIEREADDFVQDRRADLDPNRDEADDR